MSLHRRGALSIAASLLAGGCLGGIGNDDCTSGVYVDAEPFDPVAALEDRLREQERGVGAEAVENDGARRTTYAGVPFREPTLFPHGGAFYRISRETVESVDVPAFELDAEWEEGQSAPAGTEVVPFADLPENDRRAFRLAMPEEKGGQFPEGFSVGIYPAPYPDGGEGSRLIGETTWVEWEDRAVRVEVAGERTGTTERVTYAFAAERVAADAAGFRAFLADAYLVDLADAPEAQLEILRNARGEGSYEECLPASDALAALRDRLDDEEKLPEPYRNDWYVAFEGERSRLSVSEWVA
ncbi:MULTISPECIES: hypothetical protein [Halolamina]|uniref:Uncharacterized protein n=1 Tax=Halolamina pelagica TaxID=699431 RepID=A0A1I5SZN0_9EURY|nr:MULTISPECIES: hypothetical protein [Halolamina]NHX36937.1 hypothetical protein [Halolamina sp. R1-12]SFP76235.1 hypothetical protein SAMN05216277_10793 [Halolamina pelagica]